MIKTLSKLLDKKLHIQLGVITKLHGVKGDVVLEFCSDNYDINEMEPIFVEIDNYLVPFFIIPNSVRNVNSTSVSFSLDTIKDQLHASYICGKKVFVPKNKLITSYDNETESNLGFIGFRIIDVKHGELGEITDFMDIANNPLFEIKNGKTEILVPINGIEIISVDEDQNTIEIKTPDGLIDIYLEK